MEFLMGRALKSLWKGHWLPAPVEDYGHCAVHHMELSEQMNYEIKASREMMKSMLNYRILTSELGMC